MTSYTNPRPGAGLLVVDLTAAQPQDSSHFGAQTRKARHLEALRIRNFCGPLGRLLAVDAELPEAHGQRLLCAQALVDRSFDVGQPSPGLRGRRVRCRGRTTGHSDNGAGCGRLGNWERPRASVRRSTKSVSGQGSCRRRTPTSTLSGITRPAKFSGPRFVYDLRAQIGILNPAPQNPASDNDDGRSSMTPRPTVKTPETGRLPKQERNGSLRSKRTGLPNCFPSNKYVPNSATIVAEKGENATPTKRLARSGLCHTESSAFRL
jgi:hypothetical protein